MRKLVGSEWQRLWSRKSTWTFTILIYAIQGLSCWLFLQRNNKLESHSSAYVYADTFVLAGFSEQLISILNIVVLFILVSMITQEYHTGQLRLVLQRSFRLQEVLLAKLLVVIGYLLLVLLFHMLMGYSLGLLFFPINGEVLSPTLYENIRISILYYILAFCTLLAMLSVHTLIAVSCSTPTTALVTGAGFILLSFAYPNFAKVFLQDSTLLPYIDFSSMITIQYHGIPLMVTGSSELLILGLCFLLLYIIFGLSIAFLLYSQKDHFI